MDRSQPAASPLTSEHSSVAVSHGKRRFIEWVAAAALSSACWGAAAAPEPQASSFEAVVTGVSDGDTFWVKRGSESIKIRLAAVDAPESGQAFGHRSEQSLREVIGAKAVTLRVIDTDRYGRLVAHVFAEGKSVAALQVQRGMAWVYRRYSNDAALIALESEARAARAGLWADSNPTPPWDWRKASRSQR